jgi:hypothetical protein
MPHHDRGTILEEATRMADFYAETLEQMTVDETHEMTSDGFATYRIFDT